MSLGAAKLSKDPYDSEGTGQEGSLYINRALISVYIIMYYMYYIPMNHKDIEVISEGEKRGRRGEKRSE